MREWSDERVEEMMGMLLRAGVVLAAAVVAIGGIVYLVRHGGEAPAFARFQGEPPEFRSPWPVIHGVLAGRGRSIIQLGLILLIATPVARVVFSVAAFSRQRDWKYVWITLIVLGILLYSLAGGV